MAENVAVGTFLILPTIIIWNLVMDEIDLFPTNTQTDRVGRRTVHIIIFSSLYSTQPLFLASVNRSSSLMKSLSTEELCWGHLCSSRQLFFEFPQPSELGLDSVHAFSACVLAFFKKILLFSRPDKYCRISFWHFDGNDHSQWICIGSIWDYLAIRKDVADAFGSSTHLLNTPIAVSRLYY